MQKERILVTQTAHFPIVSITIISSFVKAVLNNSNKSVLYHHSGKHGCTLKAHVHFHPCSIKVAQSGFLGEYRFCWSRIFKFTALLKGNAFRTRMNMPWLAKVKLMSVFCNKAVVQWSNNCKISWKPEKRKIQTDKSQLVSTRTTMIVLWNS